jgi:hypothetical protein
MARKIGKRVRLYSRPGNDLTYRSIRLSRDSRSAKQLRFALASHPQAGA